jgi:hypothetical protein
MERSFRYVYKHILNILHEEIVIYLIFRVDTG